MSARNAKRRAGCSTAHARGRAPPRQAQQLRPSHARRAGGGGYAFRANLLRCHFFPSGRLRSVPRCALVGGPRGCSGTEAQKPICVLRSEEHTSELQSQSNLVCRLLLEKKKKIDNKRASYDLLLG